MYKKISIFLILVIIIFVGISLLQNKQISGDIVLDSSEQIIIPVKFHSVFDSSGFYTRSRNEENIISLMEKANRIWKQANIYFQIEEIVATDLSYESVPNIINGNYFTILNNENFEEDKINLFLVQNLNNINGIALGNINSVFVADYTTVNDFRTTAHELGHIFGLNHVEPSSRLLARGKNGEILPGEEFSIARNNAITIFN